MSYPSPSNIAFLEDSDSNSPPSLSDLPSTPTPAALYRNVTCAPRTPSPPYDPSSDRTVTPGGHRCEREGTPSPSPPQRVREDDDDATVVMGEGDGDGDEVPELEDVDGSKGRRGQLSEPIVIEDDEDEDVDAEMFPATKSSDTWEKRRKALMMMNGANAVPLGSDSKQRQASHGYPPAGGVNKMVQFLSERQKANARSRMAAEGTPFVDSELSVRTAKPIPELPALGVVLVVLPNPAAVEESKLVDAVCARFCADFNDFAHVGLYAHLRFWADGAGANDRAARELQLRPLSLSAVQQKLAQEKEIHWLNALPILRRLIDTEVNEKGRRVLVVSGLSSEEGIEAFERAIVGAKAIVEFGQGGGKGGGRRGREIGVPLMAGDVEGTYRALLARMFVLAVGGRKE